MSDLQERMAELEDKAADCELLGSLSADPELRAECRRRAIEFHEKARELRQSMVPERRRRKLPQSAYIVGLRILVPV